MRSIESVKPTYKIPSPKSPRIKSPQGAADLPAPHQHPPTAQTCGGTAQRDGTTINHHPGMRRGRILGEKNPNPLRRALPAASFPSPRCRRASPPPATAPLRAPLKNPIEEQGAIYYLTASQSKKGS